MTLPREAILKELELSPMWRSRGDAPGVQPEVAPVMVTPVMAAPVAETPVPAPVEVPADVPAQVPANIEVSVEAPDEPAEIEIPIEAYAVELSVDMPEYPDDETLAQPDVDVPLSQRRREAIMQMDWEALRECVANCQSCSLAQTRTQTVFGVGDQNADWLLVGEAPGAEEDKRGEPFVGQAGKLLDNMLAAIQLKRGEKVYIANVLKCRPPENRDPHGEEVVQCDPFLKRQVELIRPKLIVAMGRFAAQSILNTDAAIGTLRGKLHDYHGVPVIVTYHPAYLLRNLPDKAKAWEDLCFARATMRQLQSATASPSQ